MTDSTPRNLHDVRANRKAQAEAALCALRDAGPLPADREEALQAFVVALASLVDIKLDELVDFESRLKAVLEQSVRDPAPSGVAVWLLRLLQYCPELTESSDRLLITKAVGKELSGVFPDGYFDRQGHEVMRDLARVYQRAEAELSRALTHLQSLDRVGACRQELLQALNKKPNRGFLYESLTEDAEPLLGEFFARLLAYVETSSEVGALEAYQAVQSAAATFSADLRRAGTALATRIDVELVQTALDFVESAHRASPAANPATVTIAPSARAFPLHLQGQRFQLPVIVTNGGPGFAMEVTLAIVAESAATLSSSEYLIGRLRPGAQERVEVDVVVARPTASLQLLLQVSWENFDGQRSEATVELTIRAQRTDIDWTVVDRTRAYSLEPVESAQELVGRRDMLARLMSIMQGDTVGSAVLHGQKRVGKTSLAKALRSELNNRGYHVIYIESGDYVDPSPTVTVRQLGTRICRMMERLEGFSDLQRPVFDSSLAPLADYLDDAADRHPGARVVVVLDEFDELPVELYERDPVGNSFFLALRSLSSRAGFGLLLVGGEKIRHVMEKQADKLNKFAVVAVDYFRKDRDWDDFRELVQRPTAGLLEFQDDAVRAVFDETNGNPYFTHLLCKEILQSAVPRRDCVVAADDVEQATVSLVREAERNSFQHFWEDGILETGRAAAERSVQRRKTLIALADVLRTHRPATMDRIQQHPLASPVVGAVVQEFHNRGVLSGSPETGGFEFAVPLFDRWLRTHGTRLLLGTFDEADDRLAARKLDEECRVKMSELRELVARWPAFRGQTVTEAKVQAWLDQFPDAPSQRAMFCILQHVHFYSQSFMRKKMREVDSIIREAAQDRVGSRQLTAEELVVSYLDGPGKSGAATARLLCEERGLPASVIVERAMLGQRLSDDKVRVLVLTDDFVGTGKSACSALQALHDDIAPEVRARDVRTLFVAVVGHVSGMEAVRRLAADLQFGLQVHCCESLDESDCVFSEKSDTFPSPAQRLLAKELAQQWGARLQKQTPLGFGDLGLAVVFERSCPNNSLPILHAESRNPPWIPLFKRL